MAEQAAPAASGGRISGLFKAITAAAVGLGGGVVATYTTAVVDRVTKPGKPVANFAVTADGLTVTCQNHATGESGWWDFGDGSPLEPFAFEQPATHTYPKPGDYTVKLTVRNFLMEEADRSVPVDLTAAAPSAKPPSITNFAAESVSPVPVAPATFRVKGQVANAEKVIWDLGDGKLEVSTDTGPFERLVVFDKPGTHSIQVIGATGKQAVKQASAVTVSAPSAGTMSVVVQVIDVGVRGFTQDFTEMVPVPVPKPGTPAAPNFEKVVPARKGFTIDDAKLGKFTNPAVRNVKLVVAADKRALKMTGEWTAAGDALLKAAGGPDVMIPVAVVEERSFPMQRPSETMSAPMTGYGSQMAATMAMPPQPLGMTNPQRRLRLEIRQASADGHGQVLASVVDAKLPWTGKLSNGATATAEMVGEQLRVTVMTGGNAAIEVAPRPEFAPVVPASAVAPVPAPQPTAPSARVLVRPFAPPPSTVQQLGRPQGVRQ